MDFKEEKIHTHKERKALQNKEPYLRANIRSYLLTKRKKLENKRIYFRTKQKSRIEILNQKGKEDDRTNTQVW